MSAVVYHIRNRDVEQPCVTAIGKALADSDTVYVVGKGPSLDALTVEDFLEFPAAPILCVNESVHAIEKLNIATERLFCIQHDTLKGISNKPARATWILSSFAWDVQQGEAAGAVMYDREKVTPSRPNLTASMALSMASLAGARQAVLLAFDAAFSGSCDYAESIGHTPDTPTLSADRFIGFADRSIPDRAAEEGIKLIWQAPKNFWMIALVLRSGGSYAMKHVTAIGEQLDKHLKTPHGILLFTDQYEADVWRKVMLATAWPGWFSKIELFRPDIGFRGGVLFTDLDNYFGGDFSLPEWSSLEPGLLYMPRDPYRDSWASGLMAWRLGTVTAPYDQFSLRPITRHPNRVFGDEEIINTAMPGKMKTLEMVRSASWKKDHPKPDAVDCVLFHGTPKPWDVGLVDFGRISNMPRRGARGDRLQTFLKNNPRAAKSYAVK